MGNLWFGMGDALFCFILLEIINHGCIDGKLSGELRRLSFKIKIKNKLR
jgi:hypothetical protein